MKKRIFSTLMAFIMIVTIMPSFAIAASAKTSEDAGSWAAKQVGTKGEISSSGWSQCVWFVRYRYATDFWGLKNNAFQGGSAKDYRLQGNHPANWTAIPKSDANFSAIPGDVAVWTSMGTGAGATHGHVAVVISASGNKITVAEQYSSKKNLNVYKNTYSITSSGFWGIIRPPYSSVPNIDTSSTRTNNNYTIKYNANGGSGTMLDTIVTYGTNTKLRANSFTKAGQTFNGWFAQREKDNTWRYRHPTDSSKDGWYMQGSQPSGWVMWRYPDASTVSKTVSAGGTAIFHAQWKTASTAANKDSTLTISGQSIPSATHTKGKTFVCKGTISSNYNITSVTVGVYDTNGKMVTGGSAAPNAKSYNIQTALDAKVRFDQLDSGTYTYRINATDASGKSITPVAEKFTVSGVTEGTVTIRYNNNGGNYGEPNSHTVKKDINGVASFYIAAVNMRRTGYKFLGWRLENDPAYGLDQPGQSITIQLGPATTDETLTYYAQWEAESTSSDGFF